MREAVSVDKFAIFHLQNMVTLLGDVRVVRYDEHSLVIFACQTSEQIENNIGIMDV